MGTEVLPPNILGHLIEAKAEPEKKLVKIAATKGPLDTGGRITVEYLKEVCV
jgi:hypothetical protein